MKKAEKDEGCTTIAGAVEFNEISWHLTLYTLKLGQVQILAGSWHNIELGDVRKECKTLV